MDHIRLGVEWDVRKGRAGAPVTYDLRSHITLIAPTGAGKGVTLEIPNLLLGLRGMSVLSLDPSGQNAAVCAEARRQAGSETLMLNPFNLHARLYPDMADIGCNPLLALDPKSPNFFEDAMALGDASISVEGDSQRHFPESARGLMTWLMMFVRLEEGDKANLGTVRDLLTGDLCGAARAAVATGHPRIKSLAYKYQDESKELASVISTAETQTRWLLSDQMRESLARNGIGDFGRLKDRPTSLFLILPAGTELENHGVWLRMIVTCALNALYRRGGEGGGVPTLFMLSEFAQMGKLAPIRAAFGQARKYGIRLWPVLQDRGQLIDLYTKDGADSFIANSGCVVALTPNDPATAEWMSNFSGREWGISVSASDDPHSGAARENWSLGEERVWPSDKIRELPRFHGLVWESGRSQPQAVYLPPYWEIDACKRLARPDPFHTQTPATQGGVYRDEKTGWDVYRDEKTGKEFVRLPRPFPDGRARKWRPGDGDFLESLEYRLPARAWKILEVAGVVDGVRFFRAAGRVTGKAYRRAEGRGRVFVIVGYVCRRICGPRLRERPAKKSVPRLDRAGGGKGRALLRPETRRRAKSPGQRADLIVAVLFLVLGFVVGLRRRTDIMRR